MRLSISILLFMTILSTITNSFPLSPKLQPQLARRRAPYSVVPVDGGPKSTTTTRAGLLVTIPPRITETATSRVAVTESSSPTSTERSSTEKSYLSTATTVTPTLPPRTTPSASAPVSSTPFIYISSYPNPPYAQPGPSGGFRLQPSHITIKISYPTPSLVPLPRYGSNNGTYHLPTPSTRLLN
ncbi:hypothetical protein EMCG_03029 [[Emmonsia] crescens]|uniref:Uncharacterized protein n=1 Tax=[Emmonsia] crescens TaxID=73230 RepID=A0A0G2J0T6_9EURO|nr:hypothetical protein EMCG_03029 [Emmonsia crescens UAMH 3008]